MPDKTLKLTLVASALSFILALGLGLSEQGQIWLLDGLDHLEGLAVTHFWTSLLVYVTGFALLTMLALPVATVLTIGSGFLFGAITGPVAALSAKTLGAVLTFAFMRLLQTRECHGSREQSSGGAPAWARGVMQLLDRDTTLYVFLLRIVPLAPHFAVNAGAALTRISPLRFVVASFLGLIPAAVIYATIGAGLDSLMDARTRMTPAVLLEPKIGLPLLALAVLGVVSWTLRTRLERFRPEA